MKTESTLCPLAVAVVGLLLALSSPTFAQRVTGTVIDASAELPIAAARVQLIGPDGEGHAESATNEDGQFDLSAPRPGTYRLQVDRIGYASLTTDTLNLEFNELVTVTLRIGPVPVDLPPLSIVNRGRDVLNDLSYDALYARRSLNRQVGSNRVFVKGDPEFRSAMRSSDLLRYVKPRKQVYSRSDRTWSTCLPIVMWHGFIVSDRELAEGLLDDSAENLEGLESYRDYASMPLAVRTEVSTKGTNYMIGPFLEHIRDCGVVVMWPRRPDYPKKLPEW